MAAYRSLVYPKVGRAQPYIGIIRHCRPIALDLSCVRARACVRVCVCVRARVVGVCLRQSARPVGLTCDAIALFLCDVCVYVCMCMCVCVWWWWCGGGGLRVHVGGEPADGQIFTKSN